MFDSFVQGCLIDLNSKEQQAEAIIWFHLRRTGEKEITLADINSYFVEASLPKINVTRAKASFSRSKNVCKGRKPDYYRLTRQAIIAFDKEYGFLFGNQGIRDLVTFQQTPNLTDVEVQHARKMAELYAVLHCYENSVRKMITSVLQKELGDNWWELATNKAQQEKLKSRKETEAKNKWLTPRGSNPLYYLDWGDLLSIIRKYEPIFLPYVKDIKFVELRFEELERIRNITAHNGYLPNEEDFQRVILSFNDWCRQIT